MSNELPPAPAKSYPPVGHGATARLQEVVIKLIDTKGSISFPEYLEIVLYHSEWGYYARMEKARTGREGDFITAVSVGPLFGIILAHYTEGIWQKLGRPSQFRIAEWGAELGHLAQDILAAAQDLGPFAEALQYAIVEPLPAKRDQLARTLPRVEVVPSATKLHPMPGLVIANELIDALPFFLIKRYEGQWWEKRVIWNDEALTTALFPISELLESRLCILPDDLKDGYETELRLPLTHLLREMKSVLSTGEILLFDYGFEREDLYHPERIAGTLRTYRRHQADENPFVLLGEVDITAHVDFTSLREDAVSIGLQASPLQSQGRFLTLAAEPILRALDGQLVPNFIRQFLTLTHPAQLGTKFQVQSFTCSEALS